MFTVSKRCPSLFRGPIWSQHATQSTACLSSTSRRSRLTHPSTSQLTTMSRVHKNLKRFPTVCRRPPNTSTFKMRQVKEVSRFRTQMKMVSPPRSTTKVLTSLRLLWSSHSWVKTQARVTVKLISTTITKYPIQKWLRNAPATTSNSTSIRPNTTEMSAWPLQPQFLLNNSRTHRDQPSRSRSQRSSKSRSSWPRRWSLTRHLCCSITSMTMGSEERRHLSSCPMATECHPGK